MGGAPFDDDVRDGGNTNGDQLKFSRFAKNDVHHGAQELHRLQVNVKSMWWLITGKDVSATHTASSGEANHRVFHRGWGQRASDNV
jgi:hypothetical protein